MSWRLVVCLLVTLASFAAGQRPINSVPYVPITVPLAVRAPYVGVYLQGRQDKDLAKHDANYWAGSPLSWAGFIRVDGKAWRWMGNAIPSAAAATKVSISTDSYSSTFVFHAGGSNAHPAVELTAKFVSPVTPTDPLKQSIPLSYLQVTVRSIDELDHKVELYTDIDGRWLCDDENEMIEWATFAHDDQYKAHRLGLSKQRKYEERNDLPLYGHVYYASQVTRGVTLATSAGANGDKQRKVFMRTGNLMNDASSQTAAIRTKGQGPVFAFVHKMSLESFESRTVLQAIGHVRTPLVQYMSGDASNRGEFGVGLWGGGGTVLELEPLWMSKYANAEQMIGAFLADFAKAEAMSQQFNDRLYDDARRMHDEEYGHTLAVSTRQIFMALEYVKSPFDKNDYMVMLKEISSNGNCQTLDVIAPMLPFLLYAEPKLLPALLEPIYRYVKTGLYLPIPPPHDIGDHYPNVTGRNDFLYPGLPLEEAGNMVNLAWAAAESSKEGKKQAKAFYSSLKTWSDYIAENVLYPPEQRTTDDFFGAVANQTSLVIKGLAALRSFTHIARLNSDEASARHYDVKDVIDGFLETFLREGISSDGTHIVGQYGNHSSWFLHYNMYYDRLLDLKLFPEDVYEMQDRWYDKQLRPFGVPLDSRVTERTKTDWLGWAAAASKTETRGKILESLSNYLRHDENEVFGDLITAEDGWSVGFLTRPVVGGHFALLATDKMEQLRNRRFKGISIPDLPVKWEHVQHVYTQGKDAATSSPWTTLGFAALAVLAYVASRRWLVSARHRAQYQRVASDGGQAMGMSHARRVSSGQHTRRVSSGQHLREGRED